jgi:hypothetical protein
MICVLKAARTRYLCESNCRPLFRCPAEAHHGIQIAMFSPCLWPGQQAGEKEVQPGVPPNKPAASLRQFPIMDQKDTKLARPLYRFICFSKSNGNAMRLIWMLMNALSRLLNPLNRSSTRPPHDSHPLQSVYRDLTRATDCFQGKSTAPESCIHQLLAGWAKNLHQLGSFRHHHKGPLAPALLPVQKGPDC